MNENVSLEQRYSGEDTLTFSEKHRAKWANALKIACEMHLPNIDLSNAEIERAIDIIQDFQRGMAAMDQAAEKRNLIPDDHQKAKLRLSFEKRDDPSFAFFDYKKKVIYLSFFHLFPNRVPEGEFKDKIFESISVEGGELFVKYANTKMNLVDFAFLAGVHEYRHHLEKDIHLPEGTTKAKISRRDILDYLARDHEYRALGWMVFFAQKHDYSPQTIKTLKAMLANTIDYRQKSR